MSVISFDKKRIRIKKQNEQSDSSEEISPECSKTLNSKNIIHMGRFLKLKRNAHFENIKLRNGLVMKIHKIRKEVEEVLDKEQSSEAKTIKEEVLDLASTYSDIALYAELSTLELLDKYWEFKKLAEEKVASAVSL